MTARMRGRWLSLLLITACAENDPPLPIPATPTVTAAKPALEADLAVMPAAIPPIDSAPALAVFRASCPGLRKREDRSGLTRSGDWDAACSAAVGADPRTFFQAYFTPVKVAAGQGFATGYYEPEIAASRVSMPGFTTPIYRRPPDLVEVDLGDFARDLKGRKLRGRIDGQALVPYLDRAAIMAGALTGQGLELAWAADPYEAFLLEIQGSGRLRLPDGSIIRIGYDSQNGHDYVAIGRVLVERGELPRGGASMASILAWLRANPAKAPALLAANPSVVFFREMIGGSADSGPIGAMGIAVTPRVSVAADPAFIPLGAPLFVETTLPGGKPLSAMMVAQDTGGAIKGANRIDLFRGTGPQARAEAGSQSAPARIVILLPRAAAARLLPPGD